MAIEQHGSSHAAPKPASMEHSTSGSGSPDQRPTRPLDLDPHRAQVPSENMEYIRHLGFTPPDMASEEPPTDGHGWIYLNLLINMAQLHTINVTPDFVKDAVTEYSSKFELSHDGRKIRWRGGPDVTRTTSDSSSEHFGRSPSNKDSNKTENSPKKRLQTGTSGSTESMEAERQARRAARAAKEADHSKFVYNPIFYHKEDSDDGDIFYNVSSSTSPVKGQIRRGSSGLGSSTKYSSSSRKRRDDGPMIFYSKAKFCTDLSGDQQGATGVDPSAYKTITSQPLGTVPKSSSESSLGMVEPKGPLETQPMQLDTKDDAQISSEEAIGFSPEALRNDTSDDSPETIEFVASGLGGVQPEDNFAIRVKRQRTGMSASASVRNVNRQPRSRFYSRRIVDALDDPEQRRPGQGSSQHVISDRIVSASRKDLPTSELPPASFLPFDSTSSGDVDSDLESDVSSSPSTTGSSEKSEPHPTLGLFNTSPAHVDLQLPLSENDSGDFSDEEEDEDDRDFNKDGNPLEPPVLDAEYDITYADRLAEEIPAGSSAATAGGGSGFNSPFSEGGSTKQPSIGDQGAAEPSKSNLKRARTSDNLVNVMPGKAPKLD
jgi:hypothetical protein